MSKDAIESEILEHRRRWSALVALSLGVLVIVLDSTIVYVALPSIRQDLKFSQTGLVWVVNAFTLAFGGSLLLAGRLGDLYGHRRLFLIGIVIFTIASLACGLASTRGLLVAGRAAQGVGGAAVSTVSLSLIINMFTEDAERAKAMGIYSFICVGGGTCGLLLGGVITSAVGWHWIFLVNVPIGAAVYTLCRFQLLRDRTDPLGIRLDVWGGITLTSSLVLSVYALVNGNDVGWSAASTLGLLACAVVSLGAFVLLESRVAMPLMPLGFFGSSHVIISNAVRMLWAVGASATFFIALYMQLVLGSGPMEIGLAFLPGSIMLAAFSLGFSARIAIQFGTSKPLSAGLALGAIGLVLLAQVPVEGNVITSVLPGTLLLSLSASITSVPLLFATMTGVVQSQSGLASGVSATVAIMGNALGLAILASVSATRTAHLLAAGASNVMALTGGYRAAFLLGAGCVAAAALISALYLPNEIEPLRRRTQGLVRRHKDEMDRPKM